MKDRALKLWKRGDLHQLIRKEILFGLVPKTLSGMRMNFVFFRDEFLYKVYNLFKDSPDQMHAIGNLIQLLYYGGFLRSKNGLNSLPVFIKFADILHKPNGFKLIIGNISISNFVRNSTQAWPHRMVSNLRIKLKSFQLINTGQSSTCTIFPQTSLN